MKASVCDPAMVADMHVANMQRAAAYEVLQAQEATAAFDAAQQAQREVGLNRVSLATKIATQKRQLAELTGSAPGTSTKLLPERARFGRANRCRASCLPLARAAAYAQPFPQPLPVTYVYGGCRSGARWSTAEFFGHDQHRKISRASVQPPWSTLRNRCLVPRRAHRGRSLYRRGTSPYPRLPELAIRTLPGDRPGATRKRPVGSHLRRWRFRLVCQ